MANLNDVLAFGKKPQDVEDDVNIFVNNTQDYVKSRKQVYNTRVTTDNSQSEIIDEKILVLTQLINDIFSLQMIKFGLNKPIKINKVLHKNCNTKYYRR